MTLQTTAARTPAGETPPAAARKRRLFAACSAPAVHDGLTDVALSLLFVGGAFGKLLCGYRGARIGMMTALLLPGLIALGAFSPVPAAAMQDQSMSPEVAPKAKLPSQREAAYAFAGYYIENTDALSEVCAQQAVSVAPYTRRFVELNASLLHAATLYLDLRQMPTEVQMRISQSVRRILSSLAQQRNTDLAGVCRDFQLRGNELAEHASFARLMPGYYRALTAPVPTPAPPDPVQAYRQRIARLLRMHIHFDVPAELRDNPSGTYQVDLAPVGLVRQIKVLEPSPLAGFDEAVIKAIRAVEPFPKGEDGQVPPSVVFTWSVR